MKIIKTTLFTAKKKIKKVVNKGFSPRRDSVKFVIPYFSQWESPTLVKDIIENKISAKDDPLWRESGAKTKEEYELWSWNSCGMACLKMLLSYKFKKDFPLVELGKKCQKYGGYVSKEGRLDGLFYKPFIEFIKKDFNLLSKVKSPMVLEDIINALDKNKLVIASVSNEIRNPRSEPYQRGGHLVLVVGYDFSRRLLYLHNPSGYWKESQEYASISFEDFNKFFSYRGFTIF